MVLRQILDIFMIIHIINTKEIHRLSKHFYPMETIKEFIDSMIYTNLMHLIGTLLIN